MRQPMRKGLRGVALTLTLAAASSACVAQHKTGVGVVKFDSSAVFGVANKTDLPGFDVPDSFPDGVAISELPPVRNLIRPDTAAAPVGPCPEAKLTAFPKKTSSVTVTGMPTPGIYPWKRVDSVQQNIAKNPPRTQRPFALETRAIRRVERQSDHQFSFQMLAPDPSGNGNTVITSYMVNTNATLLVDRSIPGRTVGVVPVPTQDVRVGTPGDQGGIFLSRIETQNEKGGRVSVFAPLQPVMVIPLDGGLVRSGQTFKSLGIDPTSQTVLLNDGLVTRTTRIDACGEIVEGYTVAIKQTFSSDLALDPATAVDDIQKVASRSQTRMAEYTFATQYGALPIQEILTIGDFRLDPEAFSGRWELGGLTPKPLPDSLK